MHANPPAASNRPSMLPWILLIVVTLGGGIFMFRAQVADILSSPPTTDTLLSGDGVLQRIQDLNNLESVAFHMEVIVPKKKDGTWWKAWQDRQKAIFVADGSVTAGVNLSRLTSADVRVSEDGQVVRITLPPAEVLNTSVTDMRLYDDTTGLFGLIELDERLREEAFGDAQERLREVACRSNILEVATENNRLAIERLFSLMDGVEVLVEARAPGACPTGE